MPSSLCPPLQSGLYPPPPCLCLSPRHPPRSPCSLTPPPPIRVLTSKPHSPLPGQEPLQGCLPSHLHSALPRQGLCSTLCPARCTPRFLSSPHPHPKSGSLTSPPSVLGPCPSPSPARYPPRLPHPSSDLGAPSGPSPRQAQNPLPRQEPLCSPRQLQLGAAASPGPGQRGRRGAITCTASRRPARSRNNYSPPSWLLHSAPADPETRRGGDAGA